MKVSRWIIILFFSLCVSGCSSNNYFEVKNENQLITQEDIIRNEIQQKDTFVNVENLRIVSKFENGQVTLIMFTFSNKSKLYEGLSVIKQDGSSWRLIQQDSVVVDRNAPFTVHQMSGAIPAGDGQQKNTYIFVGGVINDTKIRSMQIYYNDGMLKKKVLAPNDISYMIERVDKAISIKEVSALDESDEIIYHYPPYPPSVK